MGWVRKHRYAVLVLAAVLLALQPLVVALSTVLTHAHARQTGQTVVICTVTGALVVADADGRAPSPAKHGSSKVWHDCCLGAGALGCGKTPSAVVADLDPAPEAMRSSGAVYDLADAAARSSAVQAGYSPRGPPVAAL